MNITAAQARASTRQVNAIENLIKRAVNRGEYDIYVLNLTQDESQELKNLGFRVNCVEGYFMISWREII